MDLTNLALFRAVALEQSVTRAAQSLQRAQSNVTTRIQQLEEELGASLFLREGKRMRLTEQGQAFLAYAEQLLALADEARQALHPAQPSGRLRLGSMESTAAARLPEPLARFHRSYPQVSLEVSTGPSQALLEGVLARRLDCALIALPQHLAQGRWQAEALDQGLEGEALFREELLLLLPADHPPVQEPTERSAAHPGGLRPGLQLPADRRALAGPERCATAGTGSRLVPRDSRLRGRRHLRWRGAAGAAGAAAHAASTAPGAAA